MNDSHCFSHFSHFLYSEGEYANAINYAKQALEKDNDSGEAYYLLGFYELFLNESDPLEYFKKDIEKDPAWFQTL